MKRTLIAAGAAMCIVAIGCVVFAAIYSNNNETEVPHSGTYLSYREIPGITQEESAQIEAMQQQGKTFVYGMLYGTEAFSGTDGKIRGFSALVCDWLTELFGMPVTIALYEWDELIDGLENGGIDFTGELTATAERRKTYFMTDPIANRYFVLIRIDGSAPISWIANTRPPRYGFLEGTVTVDYVTRQASGYFDPVMISNYDDAYAQLKEGTIDAFIEEHTAEAAFINYDDILVEDYFPLIYNPVSLSTRNPENAPLISAVDKALRNGALQHIVELYRLGEQDYRKHRLFTHLTDEELAYINEAGSRGATVRFAAEQDNYPVSFYNAREGEYQGIAHDVLAQVENLTGIRFEQANPPGSDWAEIFPMLESGEAVMVTEMIRTPEREGRFLWPANTVVTDRHALISKIERRNIRMGEILYVKVGLVKGYAHTELFEWWFPEHKNVVYFDNYGMAYDALSRDEVDMVMASSNKLLALTNYQELTGFKTSIIFNYPYGSTFGFNIDQAVLCSIVDKALRVIDTDVISAEWIERTYDYRVQLTRARLPWLIGALVLFVCVFVLAAILLWRNRRAKTLAMETMMREHELASENAMLDTLNRVKTEFFQNMSHDLKTPLTVISTSIMNTADNLNYEMDKQDMKESLELAQSEIMRMSRMIDDASKHAALQEFHKEKTELGITRLLRDGAATYKHMLARSGNKLVIDIPDNLPSVYGSADSLMHVLSNLLSNANRFTHGGVITVSATAGPEYITVSVKDTGVGVKPEMLPELFKRGVSTDSTGLGLPICKAAIDDHGGRIRVDSTPGYGTTVTFTLPTLNPQLPTPDYYG